MGRAFLLPGVALACLIAYVHLPGPAPQIPDTGYWGPKDVGTHEAAPPADDEKIYQFNVMYDNETVARLKDELERTKWVDPLEGTAFHDGVNLKTFRGVIDHWRTKFDFKKAENDINAFPHYQTEIEGLQIHFFRSAPETSRNSTVKVLPLLMVHGWPGSFVEFLKVAPQLSQPVDGLAFDVIVASIPGFGFSQASSKDGLDVMVTARIFQKLMARLGYSKFYMQGGGWGAAVSSAMAALYPEKLRGIHLSTVLPNALDLIVFTRLSLFKLFPQILGDGQSPPCMKKHFTSLLHETEYLRIQVTNPDIVGFGLLNSAAGLATYILDKFSVDVERYFLSLEDDGNLTKTFTLDELLSNVMVYYVSNSIVSSQRYVKENLVRNVPTEIFGRPIEVPTGYAVFPHDTICVPRFVASRMYSNITTMTYLADGGRFGAFEKPDLLANDVRNFVQRVETLHPETLVLPKGFTAVDRRSPPSTAVVVVDDEHASGERTEKIVLQLAG